MSLKGEAKKNYQREYMRDYMRRRRVKTPPVKTLIVKTLEPVKTPEVVSPEALDPVKTYHPIGIPVRPTAQQKAEWAKFKANQR